jgi:hemerythrin superfamily protein
MATHMKQQDDTLSHANTQPKPETTSPDAIALLKLDHRLVEDLFDQFESASSKDKKKKLVREICQELTVHASLEEHFFYPPVREKLGQDKDMIDEAVVEHSSLKWLIAQLESESIDSELYEAKVIVLKEYVNHHVKEEEKELFPKVRKSGLDLASLGQTLATEKRNLQKELKH